MSLTVSELVPTRRARLDHFAISFAVVNSEIVRLPYSLWHAACGMRSASSRRGARKASSARSLQSFPPLGNESESSVPMEIQCAVQYTSSAPSETQSYMERSGDCRSHLIVLAVDLCVKGVSLIEELESLRFCCDHSRSRRDKTVWFIHEQYVLVGRNPERHRALRSSCRLGQEDDLAHHSQLPGTTRRLVFFEHMSDGRRLLLL